MNIHTRTRNVFSLSIAAIFAAAALAAEPSIAEQVEARVKKLSVRIPEPLDVGAQNGFEIGNTGFSILEFFREGTRKEPEPPPAPKDKFDIAPQWQVEIRYIDRPPEQNTPVETVSFPIDHHFRNFDFLEKYAADRSFLTLTVRFPSIYLAERQTRLFNALGESRFPRIQLGEPLPVK